MGRLTTHVLDTANGKPGNGITGQLYAIGTDVNLIAEFTTNQDGRVDKPLLGDNDFQCGTYELVFNIGEYFANETGEDSGFLSDVVLRFNLSKDEHYHVPLLVSPWSYSTYRGS
ncbi:MAG: hydroxyisourate hydrolase [Gammaproteobacteria bacterium]|nr:hydroxyisourate hydrolase [Gammaproteobacteria bacterium]MDH3767738.1 hydroxyisourate hydrolase [Gammaproteobacteria bacterium]